MRYDLSVLLLWAIAVATLVLVGGDVRFDRVLPVLAVCMIGSVIVVRKARSRSA